ncbi:MAG: 2Fe-2S ferredoxin [Bacteroidia bacterium]|jgi:2Fe-2S ferredoxin
MAHKIRFIFENPDITSKEVECDTGDSILDVAHDNDIELQHNCGAVCACSTCHVYIEEGMDSLPEITDKEEDFIDRAINPSINSRLACQCSISHDLTVTIPDQKQFNGH